MPYRPPTHPPETAWARHLDAVRKTNGWSQVRLFEEIGPDLGYAPKSRSAILPLLWNREPDEAQAAVLRRHFGDPPAELDRPPAPEPTLAAALSALGEELRAARQERAAMEDRLLGLEATVRLLTERSEPKHSAPGAPRR